MYKIGETVECTFGIMKGKEFIVKVFLKDGWYSCTLKHENDGKYYRYTDRHLKAS